MEIVFATKNKGKLKEIQEILLGYTIITMDEAGVQGDVEEDGLTFEENALKKATEVMRITGRPTLADDSGLEVDALDGAPGVYSARYLGYDTPYEVKNQYILDQLKGLPKAERAARFVCAIAVAFPDGRTFCERAVMEGYITDAPRGENGFGYDPIFEVEPYGMTTAEMPAALKNQISHRAKALQQMKARL